MIIGSVLLVLGGLGIIGLAVASWHGRLPRNGLAGVRTPSTMRSDEAFRIANKVAAPLTAAGGAVIAVAGVLAPVVPVRYAGFPIFGGALLGIALCVAGGVKGVRACR